MCKIDVYTEIDHNGDRHRYKNPSPCKEALEFKVACSNPQVFKHPPRKARRAEGGRPSTPHHAPGSSSTSSLSYQSDSDNGSGDGKRASRLRFDGTTVVLEPAPRRSRRDSRSECIVYIDPPASDSSGSKSEKYAVTYMVPDSDESPSAADLSYGSRSSSVSSSPGASSSPHYGGRPIIVDKRGRRRSSVISVELIEPLPSAMRNRRGGSHSSYSDSSSRSPSRSRSRSRSASRPGSRAGSRSRSRSRSKSRRRRSRSRTRRVEFAVEDEVISISSGEADEDEDRKKERRRRRLRQQQAAMEDKKAAGGRDPVPDLDQPLVLRARDEGGEAGDYKRGFVDVSTVEADERRWRERELRRERQREREEEREQRRRLENRFQRVREVRCETRHYRP